MQKLIDDIIKLIVKLDATIRITDAELSRFDLTLPMGIPLRFNIVEGEIQASAKILLMPVTIKLGLYDYQFTRTKQIVRLDIRNSYFMQKVGKKILDNIDKLDWIQIIDDIVRIDVALLLKNNPAYNEYSSLLGYVTVSMSIVDNYIEINTRIPNKDI